MIVAPGRRRARRRSTRGVRLVARRRGDRDLHAGEGAGLDERVRDVVAVADVREPKAGEADRVTDGEQVGERLAGMVVVGEGVHHRHGRRFGELLDVAVRERADDDRVAVRRQRARRVGDRLAAAELELVGAEDDGVMPSRAAAAANETRVRVDGFAK